ncbi:MAG: hypothetical protein KDC44_12785 [Phaeodactylibacter sp.]|nr:hypothetical protein [Phaeodactylibacter sp.]
MKISNKTFYLFGLVLFLAANLFTTSCKKEDMDAVPEDIGDPAIHYIRSTDPDKADSLLVGAYMGSLIAIVGEDLQYTREIWFNDQMASLNPTYITNETILVNVPSSVPTEVNNMIRIVFANEEELLYEFSVNVPSPLIQGIKSEYVEAGQVAVLYGDFFFDPVTVTFAGGAEGTIVSLNKTELQVVVPDDAEGGEITVSTNFGAVKSDFLFRDDRNVVVNFDDLRSRSWNSPVAENGVGDFIPCSGGYTFFKWDDVGAWQWVNELNMMYIAEDGETGRGNVPIFPSGAIPSEWGVRFELNVGFEWREIPLEIFFAQYGEDHGRDVPRTMVRWKPWEAEGVYQTDGWETITVPLAAFNVDKDGNPAELGDISTFTNLTIMFFGAADATYNVNMAIDNVRVVKL